MGLEEEIKKEEEELAKLEAEEAEGGAPEDDEEKGEEAPGEENRDEDEEKDAEDGKDEEGDDDSDEDEEGDKDDDKDEGKSGNDAAAKLRIERKRRLKLEEELAELRRMKESGQPAQTPPGKTEGGKEEKALTADERLDRIENERQQQALQSQAIEEFQAIEKEFQKDTPDYEDASKHMITAMYQGVMRANPHATEKQAAAHVHKTVLQIASQAARNGQNPAEVLYQMAFDRYGFQPGAGEQGNAKKKTGKADNLKTIAKNKKRSASSLAGGGQGAASNATIEEAVNMDLSTFGNMSEAEIDALIEQAG